MTVNETADNDPALDEMFRVFRPVPPGYKVEIVEGGVRMWPVRQGHRQISQVVAEQLRPSYPGEPPASAGCVYMPGHLNGFAPNVLAIREGALPDPTSGRWRHQDIDLVAEVTPDGAATYVHDHCPKRTTYAAAEVPVYLVVDPRLGRCRAYTQPKDGEYVSELTVTFGGKIDLTATPVGLTLTTDEFPRD